jgi:hypothetical protein
MEKRLFLAIILSILALMVYSALVNLFVPPQPVQPVTQSIPQTLSGSSATFQAKAQVDVPSAANTILTPSPIKENLIKLSNKELDLYVNLVGSGIKNSNIKFYESNLYQSDIGLLVEWQNMEFNRKSATDYLTMSYTDTTNGLEIIKSYKFSADPYILEMDVNFVNISNTKRYVKYNLNLGSLDEKIRKQNPTEERYMEFFISMPNKMLRHNPFNFNPKNVDEKIQWVGIRDRYFCSIVQPLQEANTIIKSTGSEVTRYLLETPGFEVPVGQKVRHSYRIYLGPQNPELIANLGNGAEQSVNFGMFDSLAHILLGALKLLYKVS